MNVKEIEEMQANAFAEELLMPAHQIKELYNICRDARKMANIFEVTIHTMMRRLLNLSLI